MKIRFENYGIAAQAEISPDSDVFEVMDAIGGLLQVIGYGKDSIDRAIKEEDNTLWFEPTRENLNKWAGELCLFKGINSSNENYFFLCCQSREPGLNPFIPIKTLTNE